MKFIKYIFLFFNLFVYAQNGFQITENKKVATIPFQLINNLIFIPININGVELTFLLDSGVSETLLFSLEDKQVDFNNIEKIKFTGLGENTDIAGLKSENNVLIAGKNFKDFAHTIFIILDEDFNFSSHIGIPVNGIIGHEFFKDHKVFIDYERKRIMIMDDEKLFARKIKKFKEFPITVESNKPYLMADVEMTHEKKPSKMLLDLGNSDSVWLFPKLIPNFEYNHPNIDDYLGRGFNGDIFGKRSRIHALYIGDFEFEKPLTAMPDEYSIQHLNLVKDRKGSIGGDILRRFSVIFDYKNQKIYLKKNGDFNDPFNFNMSGIDVKHSGMSWEKDMVKIETSKINKSGAEVNAYSSGEQYQYKFQLKPIFSVAGCRKDSPAFEAGVRKDDLLVSINGSRTSDMSLESINNLLKSEEGKKIHLEVERNNIKLDFYFNLKDPIPYQDQQ